ncbi:MAG: 50S ribosomal protein L4 [Gemmatimonadota bacterium]
MLEAALFSNAGAKASGAFALPADYFDGTVNEPVLHQAVKTYLANQRQGTASTKTRARVSGGNQKPWRQKGTGRARAGTTRAPHWRGGGVVFGPSPRDYRTAIPVKVRRLARRSALNARAREGAFCVIEGLDFAAPKTSALVGLLEKMGLAGRKVLLLTEGIKQNVYLSARNVPGLDVLPWADASAYDVLWAEVVVAERPAVGGEVTDGTVEVQVRVPKVKVPKAKAKATKPAAPMAKAAKKAAPKAKVAKKAPAKKAPAKKAAKKKKGSK